MLYPHYVKTPVKCVIKELNSNISSRRVLTAKLKNNFNKSILFILMNPSKANEYESDRTINKCASIAFNDLRHLEVGKFCIVNVYPFYESDSTKLETLLNKVRSTSRSFYFKELIRNLQTIESRVKRSDYVLLGTGGIPKTITNKREYKFILNTIVSYIETYRETVFLVSSNKYNNRFIYNDEFSYHICPKGNPNTIDKIKLHKIENGKFVEIPSEKVIHLQPIT